MVVTNWSPLATTASKRGDVRMAPVPAGRGQINPSRGLPPTALGGNKAADRRMRVL